MNKNDFNRFVAGGLVPGSSDLEGARELTSLFPWFHSAHLVLLRGLRESSDIKFESQLKGSALYVADRGVLYNYLFMNAPDTKEIKVADVIVPETVEKLQEPDPEPEAEINDNDLNNEEPQGVIPEPEMPTEVPVVEIDVPDETQEEFVAVIPEPEMPSEVPAVEIDAADETQEEFVAVIPEPEEIITVAEAVKGEEIHTGETSLRSREELIAEIESRLGEIEEEELLELTAGEEILQDEEINGEIVSNEVTGFETVIEETVAVDTTADVTGGEETISVELPGEESIANEIPEEESLAIGLPEEESASKEPAEQLSPNDLIDRFIMTSPRIERMTHGEVPVIRDLTEEKREEHTPFITETLARIYVNQGYYTRAINIYEKLALQFPEKSTYFASRIEKIKELIK